MDLCCPSVATDQIVKSAQRQSRRGPPQGLENLAGHPNESDHGSLVSYAPGNNCCNCLSYLWWWFLPYSLIGFEPALGRPPSCAPQFEPGVPLL